MGKLYILLDVIDQLIYYDTISRVIRKKKRFKFFQCLNFWIFKKIINLTLIKFQHNIEYFSQFLVTNSLDDGCFVYIL